MNNTKARSMELAAVARTIAARHPEQILAGGRLLPLAKEMMDATGCSVDTAKRHIAKQSAAKWSRPTTVVVPVKAQDTPKASSVKEGEERRRRMNN